VNYHYDIFLCELGKFFVLDSLKGLHFCLQSSDSRVKKLKNKYQPQKGLVNKSIAKELDLYFKKKSKLKKIKISILEGTNLQKEVWRHLTKIAYGKTISYSDLALKTNKPKAVRAVASAIGKNPIAIVVPCHRVISKDGSLGGYAWGLKMKAKLLDIEGSGMADSTYRGGK
jgi:methylated-DNA-[protein]-cysteine S-methyltransferase